jgi:hypothetical protein
MQMTIDIMSFVKFEQYHTRVGRSVKLDMGGSPATKRLLCGSSTR